MGNGKLISSFFLLFSILFVLFTRCKHNIGKAGENPSGGGKTQMTESDIYPAYVKYRSFQNPDSTWGYTIFVNSKPYLYYSRLPFERKGFPSRKEAEFFAELFVKMIRNGDLHPKLSKKLIDSLKLNMIETSIGE